MQRTQIRHLIRLRATLLGVQPPIRRDLAIDDSLSLHDLHDAIRLSMGWTGVTRHEFSDTDPGLPDTVNASECWEDDAPLPWHDGYRRPRRWGDRWTMIDHRDPSVVEDAATLLSEVLFDGASLFYSCGSRNRWWFRLDVREHDLGLDGPPAALDDGIGRAPFEDCAGPAEHNAVLDILNDPGHPEHVGLRRWLAKRVGPWGHYDIADIDRASAQCRLDARFDAQPRESRPAGSRAEHELLLRVDRAPLHGYRTDAIDELLAVLPRSARAGLIRHVDEVGMPTPATIIAADAAGSIRPFEWMIRQAADDGLVLIEGAIDAGLLRSGATVLGWSEERMNALVTATRTLGLVYLRNGRLIAPKAVREHRDDPVALWWQIADRLMQRRIPGVSRHLKALVLLATADGTLESPVAAGAQIALALEAIQLRGASSAYRPWIPYDGCDPDEIADFDPARPLWNRHSAPGAHGTRGWTADDDDAAAVLSTAAPLLDLLTMLGLQRSVSGEAEALDFATGRAVDPALREFARACLVTRHDYSGFDDSLPF